MRGNIVVGQSGGPTAVINSSVAGVYAAAKKLGVKKIYGMVHGIEGFLQDNLIDLGEYLDDETGIELLKRTPSAFLGSCRFKMPKIEGHEDVYEKVFEIMEKHDIECLFYAGGNDSMDTVKMLSDYAAAHNKPQRFMGVPKTIDNDLPVTDHCPGYGSAAKYIATSMKEIIRDNESFGVEKPTVCIVEIMGRHAGWLTAAAALSRGEDCSGPDAIYLPEVTFDMDKFMEKVKYLAATKSSVVIAVSEGIALADGRFVCELGNASDFVDAFGHKQLSGCAATLANKVAAETGLNPRFLNRVKCFLHLLLRFRVLFHSKLVRDPGPHIFRIDHQGSLTGRNPHLCVGMVQIMRDPVRRILIADPSQCPQRINQHLRIRLIHDLYDRAGFLLLCIFLNLRFFSLIVHGSAS